ncbi:mitochondrial 54S ribosomal protein mL38 KNAG_0C05450 [Huiozyma naganishii CBS 8797]|uniref:Large ribosomal subunit protein mL38 n=1 Tax=Huiozyma naganishii (strain ATCC MYA-139 / BCRC 22969 / CBS 8797 / KCTC 17520 / NBRC 10181 / NCYC 3082 / Yp74L-3) TaxID=1071383 RepID=J7RJE7_HUIN7|nr:hypothetical protein KNAG_0C05450 [Kazachstania naganishii CBS 8797]CCK69643.1 hypothetical protein KNAG_0C05450 [Kazachstania naganishii CBS 8797]
MISARRSIHCGAVVRNTVEHVWASAKGRPAALNVKSARVKQSLLNGSSSDGPASLHRRSNRLKYRSPELIDEVFASSYAFLEAKAAKVQDQLDKHADAMDASTRETLLRKVEINNPEVQYNFQFSEKVDNNPELIDYNVAVYRYLGKKHWESKAQMLLMQRLETLHVIPDTLPTLDPRVDVHVKFPYSTGVNKWIEPGEMLSSNVTAMEPVFKLQEFDRVNPEEQLYTVLVVNPDEPDLARDSYKTSLCYGLTNLKVSYNDNVVDARRFTDENVLMPYLPPVPEKNAGIQRFATWVFRQTAPLTTQLDSRDEFDLRAFVKDHQLDPVGAHVWRSTWDLNVRTVREKYNLPAGRVFSKVRKSIH